MAEPHEHHIDIGKIPQPFHDECCIYRVHEGLRRGKPEAYVPMVVSIGPYYHKKKELQAMESHKHWYLKSLLERINEKIETYIEKLTELEERVRNFYEGPIDLTSKEFVEMMLLDGCFIIEFFRDITPNPALSSVRWIKDRICWDIMLLENQLPFFLLSDLYAWTSHSNEEHLKKKAKLVFSRTIPPPCLNSQYFDQNNVEFKHLLHLVSHLCQPAEHTSPKEGLNIWSTIRFLVLLPVRIPFYALILLVLICLVLTTGDEDDTKDQMHVARDETRSEDGTQNDGARGEDGTQNQMSGARDETRSEDDTQNQMYGAVELEEAGVKFKKVGEFGTGNANLFDIKFEGGLMEVPCFIIDGSTDTFFRNLIAFEQYSSDNNSKSFTDYMYFMDQLVSSEKDVELLRRAGIIRNHLGDDKEVSILFNKLGNGVIVDSRDSFFIKVREKVNKHCGKIQNKAMAKLKHDYFNSPWASISTLGAIVLLGLAIAQTYGTFR